MLNGDSPTATRTLRIAAPIELQANTYVKRVGSPLPYTRTLQLAGPISGSGNLTLESGNGSYTTAIHLTGDNSFTGDVTVIGGSNLTIEHVNALGNQANQVSFTGGGSCVFTFGALADGSTILNDIDLAADGSTVNPYWTWNDATASNRDVTLAGNITGGKASSTAMCFFSRDWRRVFLAGDNSFYGNMKVTAGSEVVVSGANTAAVTLENAGTIILNESASSSLAPEATTGLLIQGAYTLNTPFQITNVNVADTNMAPVATIGQMNDGTTGYNAVFTGDIRVQEDDYQALNLYAEEGGSARFSGNVYGTAGLGFTVNRSFDEIEEVSAGTRRYGNSTGAVIFDAASCVALTDVGTDSIGPVSAERGTLQIDTDHFYASTLTIASEAILSGSGRVSAHVALSGRHAPGNSVGVQTLGSAAWEPGGSLALEINDAAGTAGSGWDLVILGGGAGVGTLDLTGLSSASPFEIRLVSLDGDVAGDAAGFASTEPCDWVFITYDALVDNYFQADLFTLNTEGFSNETGEGFFTVVQVENGLAIQFVPEPGGLVLLLLALFLPAIRRR